MSIHSNQAEKGGPTSDRKTIRGSNPTYRTSLQKQSRTKSSTNAAGKGSDAKETVGSGSAPANTAPAQRATGFGSGHYQPNK